MVYYENNMKSMLIVCGKL